LRLALVLLVLGAAAADASGRPLVGLTFVGPPGDRAGFSRSLRELLQRLEVDLVAPETDAPLPKDRLIAIVTADWSATSEATITVVDARQRVVLVRRLTRTGSAPMVIEAAVHITHSVIEELLAAREVAPVAPPRVTAPSPPASEEVSGATLALGAFLAGRGFGPGSSVAIGGGLNAALSLSQGRWRPSIGLQASYQAPFEIRSDWIQLSVQTISLRLGPAFALLRGSSWRVDLGLEAGADLFVTAPHSSELPPDRVGRPQLVAAPVLSGLIAGHLALARTVDLWLAVDVDVDLAPRRFVAELGPVKQELFSPWRVRPGMLLGFSFSAIGESP
jgi:hypothetical protein